MLQNYLKIAYRNLFRHKLFSFINIFGLALSMSIGLIVLMIIKKQFEYDTFHPYPERTFRLITEVQSKEGDRRRLAATPLALGEELQREYGFVDKTVRLYPSINTEASDGKKKLEMRGTFADSSFFDVFGFALAFGNPTMALREPYSVVLTEETADKFSGSKRGDNESLVGKTLALDGYGDFRITGILKKTDQLSHIDFPLIASMSTVPSLVQRQKLDSLVTGWNYYDMGYTYVLLKPGTKKEKLAAILPGIAKKALTTFEFKSNEKAYSFEAQALGDITPGEELWRVTGFEGRSLQDLVLMSAFVFIILLMACFNYVNLSIARSLSRAKEVGIRKVAGAFRHHLFAQFLTESVLTALLALLLAYAIMPWVPLSPGLEREIAGVEPDFALFVWFLIFSVFVGLLAGAFPAGLLSAFPPVQVLKSLSGVKLFKGMALRKTFVVVQFSLSLVFMIFLTVMYQQTNYMAAADYGFNQKNMINVRLQGRPHQSLANEISRISGVERVAAMSHPLGFHASGTVQTRNGEGETPVRLSYYAVDRNFVPNLGLTLVAGRNFPEVLSAQREQWVLVNQKALAALKLGTPTEAIGKTLWLSDSTQVQVLGVLGDFHFESLKFPVLPLALRYKPDEFHYLRVQVAGQNLVATVARLEEVWKRFDSANPLEYGIFDEKLREQYLHLEEMRFFGFLAVMALTIASLGLLGMVTFTVEVRTKEVGIRKVMGADVGNLILLLSKDFAYLLILAGLISLPLGYWLGDQFLNSYANRTSIGVGSLLWGFLVMLGLGLFIICSQTFRAASANPVKALRSE